MSVVVTGHVHAPPVRIPGHSVELIIQTGTIVTDFGLTEGDPVNDAPDPEGWHRDQLRVQVLDLSLLDVISSAEITAIATASPASLGYVPRAVDSGVGSGLRVSGEVVVYVGTDGEIGTGIIELPVFGTAGVT